MNSQLETVEQARRSIVDLAIKFGPKVVAAIVILILGFIVARWVATAVEKWLAKVDLEPPIRTLLLRLTRVLVLGLFAIMALQNLGVELLPLIAGLGVAGAGVALAMQGVLSNLAAGLTIIFTKPFRVGEYIQLAGVEGRVESIDLFSTKLSHADLSRVVIPNRKIVGEILHNYGRIRQLEINVGVAYDTDLTVALAIAHDIVKRNPRALKDPAPVVRTTLLADSAINLCVAPWVSVPDYIAATGEITKAIAEEFRARGISIPFPQREVRLLNSAA